MRKTLFAALFSLSILAAATPAAAVIVWIDVVITAWDASGPTGWTDPVLAATVSGDEALGEYAEDVSANCASVPWAQASVGSVDRDGSEWVANIGARGFNNGTTRADDCSIFIDFAGGGVYDLPVEFK